MERGEHSQGCNGDRKMKRIIIDDVNPQLFPVPPQPQHQATQPQPQPQATQPQHQAPQPQPQPQAPQPQVCPASLATVVQIQQSHRRGKKITPGTTSKFYDSTTAGYGWLLPGWVVEERHMKSGKLYRFYYDPSGRQYLTKRAVTDAWERAGLVLIDK